MSQKICMQMLEDIHLELYNIMEIVDGETIEHIDHPDLYNRLFKVYSSLFSVKMLAGKGLCLKDRDK